MKDEEENQFKSNIVNRLIDGTIPIINVREYYPCVFYYFKKSNMFYGIDGWVMTGCEGEVNKIYLSFNFTIRSGISEIYPEKELSEELLRTLQKYQFPS